MRCKTCGAELRSGATFCQECGNPVKKETNNYDNPYVLVTGTKVNLEEKTGAYNLARSMWYKSIIIAFFWWVPLLPFILGIPIVSKYSTVESMLSRYEKQTNIVNVLITDKIRSLSFRSLLISILAMVSQLVLIILIIVIVSFISNMNKGFGSLF